MNLKICIIDMNNGLENQAMRAFKEISFNFIERVRAKNKNLDIDFKIVSPRDKGELPTQADLYLSTGGPGSPFDGASWELDYFKFLDNVAKNDEQFIFAVCHSYQIIARWSNIGRVQLRYQGKKFGIMPIYVTDLGQQSSMFEDFGDRLFAFEHRDWEVVDVNPCQNVLARESRDGISKGRGVLAIDFGNGIEGVQFHPEADPIGIRAWICKEDKKKELINSYGEELWEAMIKTIDREDRVIKTRNKIIPGWLIRKFNILAKKRGWSELTP